MSRTRKTCRYVCRSVSVYNSIRKELSKKIEQASTYTHRKSWVDIAILPTPPHRGAVVVRMSPIDPWGVIRPDLIVVPGAIAVQRCEWKTGTAMAAMGAFLWTKWTPLVKPLPKIPDSPGSAIIWRFPC